MTFTNACETANKALLGKGYINGFTEIVESNIRWIFVGRFSKTPGVEYGNTPVFVMKDTGECGSFPFNIIKNFDEYYEGEEVEVPKEYRI